MANIVAPATGDIVTCYESEVSRIIEELILGVGSEVMRRDSLMKEDSNGRFSAMEQFILAVGAVSLFNEGENRPVFRVSNEGGLTRFEWTGTWTANRWLTIDELPLVEGGSATYRVAWDSGTGKPSRFLGRILGECLLEVSA